MGLTNDEHSVRIGEAMVSVTGHTGPVHATWTLRVNDQAVDSAKAAGDFKLHGKLPDGTPVEAQVHQSLVGPTRVVVLADGQVAANFKGFVA